jgi:integrase
MAIRKRPTRAGLARMKATGCTKNELPSSMITWLADCVATSGKRHFKQFPTRKAASDWLDQTRVDVKAGVHVPESQSKTVAGAAPLWLRYCREGDPTGDPGPLERATTLEYERHVKYLTDPEIGIGTIKLTKLTLADVDAFLRRLREQRGKTAATARKVRGGLGNLLGFAMAQDPPLVARNVLRSGRRRRSKADREEKRITIPSKSELRLLLAADDQTPLWFRAFLAIAIYGGLRASEIRGLPWSNVDLKAGVIKVRQRADFAGRIGAPKSKAGNRDVPMTPAVRTLLKELFIEQGRPVDGLVFATRSGRAQSLANIVRYQYHPLQKRLGINPRYGVHVLRHAAASLFIEQGWTPKKVQIVMGHSSIKITYDVYGKLFHDDAGDQAAMAALQASLMG